MDFDKKSPLPLSLMSAAVMVGKTVWEVFPNAALTPDGAASRIKQQLKDSSSNTSTLTSLEPPHSK